MMNTFENRVGETPPAPTNHFQIYSENTFNPRKMAKHIQKLKFVP